MLLNGAIDRDLYAIDIQVDLLGNDSNEIKIKDCCAFAIMNKGNVTVRINGNIDIVSGDCNTRSYPNYLGLDYAHNKQLEFLTDGVVDPVCKIELTRVYLIKKKLS